MAKKKRRRPKLPTVRSLEKKADKVLSLLIRKVTVKRYGKCPLCLEGPVECCFHFVRRRRKILRWDLRNVIGACHRCNYIEYRNPDLSRAWYIRRYGARQYLEIVEVSKTSKDFTREELQELITRLGSLLERNSENENTKEDKKAAEK